MNELKIDNTSTAKLKPDMEKFLNQRIEVEIEVAVAQKIND